MTALPTVTSRPTDASRYSDYHHARAQRELSGIVRSTSRPNSGRNLVPKTLIRLPWPCADAVEALRCGLPRKRYEDVREGLLGADGERNFLAHPSSSSIYSISSSQPAPRIASRLKRKAKLAVRSLAFSKVQMQNILCVQFGFGHVIRRAKVSFDGLERVSSQTLLDMLEVPQRGRTAGTYRRLAKLMADMGWTAVRVRDLTRGGYIEQVRGSVRDRRCDARVIQPDPHPDYSRHVTATVSKVQRSKNCYGPDTPNLKQ
jgi:hypothetical protein